MSSIMAVLLNGIAELEYDRDKVLPDYQAAYLDKMDVQMKEGISIGEELISDLAVRLPELKQVKIEDHDGEVSVELVFDQEYRKQVAVQLTSLH